MSSPLQAFLTVHERGTVTAAAAALGIGQTAVTQRIQTLERELGVTLFTRGRKGMTLTTEGRALLKYCLRSKELEGEALAAFRDSGSAQEIELRIAGPTSFISGRAVPACVRAIRKWPRLNLQFIIDDRENRLSLLKEGMADIVVLYPHQVPLELDSRLLRPDEYVLLGHPSWRGRELADIIQEERLFAFHAADATSLNYLRAFDLLKHLKRPRLYVNENRALATLLCEGVGFGILSREIAAPLLAEKKLIQLNPGKAMKDPLAIAWYPRPEMPAYFKEVLAQLK